MMDINRITGWRLYVLTAIVWAIVGGMVLRLIMLWT